VNIFHHYTLEENALYIFIYEETSVCAVHIRKNWPMHISKKRETSYVHTNYGQKPLDYNMHRRNHCIVCLVIGVWKRSTPCIVLFSSKIFFFYKIFPIESGIKRRIVYWNEKNLNSLKEFFNLWIRTTNYIRISFKEFKFFSFH
jgi:hypothetical protein